MYFNVEIPNVFNIDNIKFLTAVSSYKKAAEDISMFPWLRSYHGYQFKSTPEGFFTLAGLIIVLEHKNMKIQIKVIKNNFPLKELFPL